MNTSGDLEVSAFERRFLSPEGVAASVVVRVLHDEIIDAFRHEEAYRYARHSLNRWLLGSRGSFPVFPDKAETLKEMTSVTASAAIMARAFRGLPDEDWDTFWRMAQRAFSLAEKPFPDMKILINGVRARMEAEGILDPRYEDESQSRILNWVANSINPNHPNVETSERILRSPAWTQAIETEVAIVGAVIRAIRKMEAGGQRISNEFGRRAVIVGGLLQWESATRHHALDRAEGDARLQPTSSPPVRRG
ncbi:hypothetical protein [Roseiflexus castenholzii]|uniref:hypothetical protein n=1 Tax=Roseiflexus castenholzii TaxID=120962 RepID=UPI003C7A81EB